MGFIYKITNRINDKIYIGQTSENVEHRWKEHQYASTHKSYRDYNSHLHRAIRKYGRDNFIVEIIESVDDELLDAREIYWIGVYDSHNIGYNMTLGGDGSRTLDYSLIYQLWDDGYGITDISAIVNCSCVQAREVLKGHEGYSKEESFSRGVKIFKKCVCQYDLSGSFINKYNSATDAAKACHISLSNILAVCHFHQKTAGGFQWRFENAEPDMHVRIGRKKQVNQFDINGNLKATFESISDAARALNCSDAAIHKACSGENASSCGYFWRFVGDELTVNDTQRIRIQNRRVMKFTLDGAYIETFDCIKHAAKTIGVSYNTIYNACVNPNRSSCGFLWRFEDAM